MDITSFVVQGREQALLYGDYSTYHGQLAKRLLSSRKKLGIVTKNRGKFQRRDQVAPQDVSSDNEHVHRLLLTSERAWAQAMSIKASHSAAQKDITGRARSHIISRLNKAAQTAQGLVDILTASASGATANDVLEAKSYASLMRGAMMFEKHNWELCLQNYAASRVIYNALANAGNGDLSKDLLSETIDPSLRYAAYQLKTPRTVPISTIAKKSFPRSDAALVQAINQLDANILAEGDEAVKLGDPTENAPRTITWRSREVQIEDAQISLAWASVEAAKTRLASNLAQSQDLQPHKVAVLYDEILMATQDAVDATKHAIDELNAEGVAPSDNRMQSLQVTRTAVNYEMISWRVGRNRVLTGHHDGGPEEYKASRRRKAKAPKDGDSTATEQEKGRELPPSKKLAKLKEKVALYDGTLQNLQSIKELPGVAADQELATKIDGYEKYFETLKCLSIARSHAIGGTVVNALALINHASSLIQDASSKVPLGAADSNQQQQQPLSIDVHPEAVSFLSNLVNGELQRHRAIAHIHNLRDAERKEANGEPEARLVDSLHTYPRRVNLRNLVQFPPKMELIPVKPIFLDVAWNYIDYPTREPQASTASATTAAAAGKKAGEEPKKKGGWFGFGR
ncbi:signal recognition particle subunit srp68 [Conoideocrella luteorostrata]|uniref:Signal recognition particle subunit SRP68 n=1 Tax=Conoideocrella luteorostrata TaxID=1105319 RepID=A0AAJ0D0N8_9HYPO|nr:signal recognition particle subunit srp68 [Conoideocrella luteorostrata]